jgi:DNA primase large subunit
VQSAKRSPEPKHIERVVLVIFLIRAGFSDAQIHKIFSAFSNYDTTITQQQIDHAREKQYNCYACVAMEKNELCFPNVACKYLPQRYPLYYYQQAKLLGSARAE